MNPEELRQLLAASGWSCRVERHEVTLEVCYFCGNAKHNLGLNPDKGLYYCWACRAGGRLDRLLQSLTGDTHHIPVQLGQKKAAVPAAKQATEFQAAPVKDVLSASLYLERRGMPTTVVEQYGLVVCTEAGHRLMGRICIPMKNFWTGETEGWVGRSYTGKNPKYLSTLERKVITGWRRRDQAVPAVVVEGPLDGIAAHRAGFQVAVLSGVGGAGVLEWASRLPPKTSIAVMLDGEALVQAQRLYWEIKTVRPTTVALVHLPAGEDPAKVGPEGVQAAVRSALSGM